MTTRTVFDLAADAEAWASIDRFEGYRFSSFGVTQTSWGKTTKTNSLEPFPQTWRNLKYHLDAYGYPSVGLRLSQGKRVTMKAHSLILMAFIGPRPPGMVCRHLDGNKLNNRLHNICWGTHSENTEDQRKHNTMPVGSRQWMSKLVESDVEAIRAMLSEGVKPKVICEQYGVCAMTVSRIRNRHIWKHV